MLFAPRSSNNPDGMQTGLPSDQGQQKRSFYRYHFNVGSIDSFERKLEEAQEDLGWDAANFVPVTYSNEMSLGSELVKLLPTLLIIAGYVWFTRRQMGGLGGGGAPGGRGIFNVGKAHVSCPRDASCKQAYIASSCATCLAFKLFANCCECMPFVSDSMTQTYSGSSIPSSR